MQAVAILNGKTALVLSPLTLLFGISTTLAPAATPLLGTDTAPAMPPGGDDDDLDDLEIQR